MGYAELGCYGQKKIQTPNIDRIAAEGIRFTQFYCGAPVCAPSRCVLLTGKHLGHSYIRDNSEFKPEGQMPIPDGAATIAERLKPLGYATCAIGKWGLGGPDSTGHPNLQGFDHWFGYLCQRHAHNHYPKYLWRNDQRVELEGNTRGLTGEQYSQDLFREEALAFIRENRDRPFFLYLPFIIPHLAIQVPEKSLEQYKGQWPDPPYEGDHGYLPHPAPRAGYAAMISHMDRDIGAIMNLVAELGLDDNTLIIFTSDNGPTYDRLGGSDSDFFESAGPLNGLKGSVLEGGIRVPMVARWPGHIASGGVSDLPAVFYDMTPTLCQLAGAPIPEQTDGISFAPTLLGHADDQPAHEFLYWEFPSYGGQQAVRMGPWKGVRQNMLKGNLKLELYNLDDDIGEKHDVAAEHPQIVARIEQIMKQQHVDSKQFPFPAIDAKKEPAPKNPAETK